MILVTIAMVSGCTSHKPEGIKITEQQKKLIEVLAQRLLRSIKDYDHTLINSTWNNNLFKNRVAELNSVQQSVFDHIFEKDLKRQIKVRNASILNYVNLDNGNIYLTNIDHQEFHSEVTYLFVYDQNFNFVKYRMEIYEEKAVLSDFYNFILGTWMSQGIVKNLKLNSKYHSGSDEITALNDTYIEANDNLILGDTIGAYNALSRIKGPSIYVNMINIERINLALALNDSTLLKSLAAELTNTESIYPKYWFHYNMNDTLECKRLMVNFTKVTGGGNILDSLMSKGYYWN